MFLRSRELFVSLRQIFIMNQAKRLSWHIPASRTAWDRLSLEDQADFMERAVKNGIYDLYDIRGIYNEMAKGGRIVYGRPHYSYDNNGRRVDDTLNYNATVPEITVIPDSRKSPAQRNEDERFRQRSLADYQSHRDREYTARQSIEAQKQWENSTHKKVLDFGISAAQGLGMASDVTSSLFGGIPVYSGLKSAQALDRATQSGEVSDYVDAGLWLSPMLTVAGKRIYDAAKPVVRNIFEKGTPAAEWAGYGRKQPEFLNFGNTEDGAFKFEGFSEDPVQMHLKRAEAKGYNTSGIKIWNLSSDDSESLAFLQDLANQDNTTVDKVRAQLLAHLGAHGHAANVAGTKIVVHDGKGSNMSARLSHEIDHLLHYPKEPLPQETYHPRLFKIYGDYFTRHNNTEVSARGSQLHDYFGHTGNEPITEDMLEYAKQHYVQDTGLDNDMHDFLWTIKDPKGLAEWLTKYATGIAPIGIFGNSLIDSKHE